jgi:hypothetical protein
MNETLWNSTEEAFGYFLLGALSIFIHAYAMFLCSAISDYQDEKPKHEKSPFDEFIKDLMNFQFFFIFYSGLIHFIGLFSPPIEANNLVYFVTVFGILIRHFNAASYLITLFTKYVFIFHPNKLENIPAWTLKKKRIVGKFLLTLFAVLISIEFPTEELPFQFEILTKKGCYDG